MPDAFERIQEAAQFVRARSGHVPAAAIVLGSGLGDFAGELREAVSIAYEEIPHWPPSHVVGHAGQLVVGTVSGRRVAALSGRAHFYEGHPFDTVVFATRVIATLGVKNLVLTGAAGGVNTRLASGALMVIDDHMNLMGGSPLIGPNDDRLGPRFPDMTTVYSSRLRTIATEAARDKGIPIAHGIYAAMHGPQYETPAEIRLLRTIGADAVGMSIVPEAIAARHMGVEVLGLACITNMAAGVLAMPVNHEEVLETAKRVRGSFVALLEGIVERL